MKKLFVFSLLFLLGACAEGSIYKKYDQDCNDHFYSRKDCPAKEEKAKAPEKVYVYREARPEPRRSVRPMLPRVRRRCRLPLRFP